MKHKIVLIPDVLVGQVKDKFFRKDYYYVEETNSFYKEHVVKKTWAGAKARCELEGASLFYPEDDVEVASVIEHWNKFSPQSYSSLFIGIADWNVKEVFETIDGRSVSAVYNNWAYGEPNNADDREGCVILLKDGTLYHVNCDEKFSYVCKKPLATLLWNEDCNIPNLQYVYNEELRKCYKFHLTPRNWTEALTVCYSEQSYLAIIDSDQEADHLVNITALAPKESIGGDYLYGAMHLGFLNNYGWVTIKGIPLNESGYSRWAYLQPDGGDTEKCGSMFFSGELNDIGCFQKMFFICEHDPIFRFKNK